MKRWIRKRCGASPSRVLGEVEPAVARHGGTIETVTGDAVTAVFGLPQVHEDDALRAARAAAEVRDALSVLAAELTVERGLALDFRIGISTGEVITAVDARPSATNDRRAAEALVAPRPDSKPGEILFDEGARRLLRDAVLAEAANGAWRLLQVADTARAAATACLADGRPRARAQTAARCLRTGSGRPLLPALHRARPRRRREVPIGAEFLDGVAGQALVARGRCLPYGEGITYWPLVEAVNEAVGLEDTDTPDEARGSSSSAFGDEQGAEVVARHVAEMIGLAEVAGTPEEGFVAVRGLFEALARTRPLVLVFDDIHWAEATFLDLVEHLADWTRDAPILLVCLARPELLDVRPGWGGGKLNATVALLEPLSDDECGR